MNVTELGHDAVTDSVVCPASSCEWRSFLECFRLGNMLRKVIHICKIHTVTRIDMPTVWDDKLRQAATEHATDK